MIDPFLFSSFDGLSLRSVARLALHLFFQEVRDAKVHDAIFLVLELLVVQKLRITWFIRRLIAKETPIYSLQCSTSSNGLLNGQPA